MKVRALRGVCVGVNHHLVAGEDADLDAHMVTFLKNIGAVELVPDEPVAPAVREPEHQEPESKLWSKKKEK